MPPEPIAAQPSVEGFTSTINDEIKWLKIAHELTPRPDCPGVTEELRKFHVPEYDPLSTGFDIYPGRSLIERTVVVMTSGTIRFDIVPPVAMAIAAISLHMRFVQLQAGDRVLEVLLIPCPVAGDAIGPKPGYSFTGRMTSATFQFDMVLVERPARRAVGECRLFPGIVAGLATVGSMTPGTDGMYLGFGLGRPDRLFDVMAAAAVFLRMAVDATEVEQFGMVLVEKGDDRFVLV